MFLLGKSISVFDKVPLGAVVGASIGGLLAFLVPYVFFKYATVHGGGGVPIGGDLSVLLMSVRLPIGMVIGAIIGSRCKRRSRIEK